MGHTMQRCIVLLIAGVLLFSLSASAQTRGFATSGCAEIAGSISFSSYTSVVNGVSSNSSISTFNFSPQLGYFVTDGLELGLSPGISFIGFPPGITSLSGGGESETIFQYFVTGGYNFALRGSDGSPGMAFPFVEMQLGHTSLSSGGDDHSGFSWGLRGGVKIAPTDHLLVNIGAAYHAITLDPTGASNRYGFNYFDIGVGIGGYF